MLKTYESKQAWASVNLEGVCSYSLNKISPAFGLSTFVNVCMPLLSSRTPGVCLVPRIILCILIVHVCAPLCAYVSLALRIDLHASVDVTSNLCCTCTWGNPTCVHPTCVALTSHPTCGALALRVIQLVLLLHVVSSNWCSSHFTSNLCWSCT